MFKNITSFIILLLVANCTNEPLVQNEEAACDNGTFVGLIILETQQEIIDFGAQCYSKIDGTIVIRESNQTEDHIVDLSPLSSLKEIFTATYPDSLLGSILICDNDFLTDLQGLNNIEKLSRLVIKENQSLVSLDGMEGLVNISSEVENQFFNELVISNNPTIENIDGLENLVKIGNGINPARLEIANNPNLSNLDGLASLKEIHPSVPFLAFDFSTNLDIVYNNSLTNLDGLSELNTLHGGNLNLFNFGDIGGPGCNNTLANENLVDFCGLQGLLSFGDYNMAITTSPCNDYFEASVEDIINGYCSQ